MKHILTYIKILTFILLTSLNTSCDEEDVQPYSQEFFYGVWNGKVDENPPNFPWYLDGFVFKSGNQLATRYYRRDSGKWESTVQLYYEIKT